MACPRILGVRKSKAQAEERGTVGTPSGGGPCEGDPSLRTRESWLSRAAGPTAQGPADTAHAAPKCFAIPQVSFNAAPGAPGRQLLTSHILRPKASRWTQGEILRFLIPNPVGEENKNEDSTGSISPFNL